MRASNLEKHNLSQDQDYVNVNDKYSSMWTTCSEKYNYTPIYTCRALPQLMLISNKSRLRQRVKGITAKLLSKTKATESSKLLICLSLSKPGNFVISRDELHCENYSEKRTSSCCFKSATITFTLILPKCKGLSGTKIRQEQMIYLCKSSKLQLNYVSCIIS